MSGAQVYRVFDAADRLLYVGCSVAVDARLNQHAQSADWWLYQDRIERETFATRNEALAAESEAIATEHPRWNINGRSQDHPDGYANSIHRATWLHYERDVARRRRELIEEESRLLSQIRKARMSLAGVNAEVACIKDGYVFDEAVA